MRQQTCQLGSSMLFCLTLLAAVVDERRTVDLFSHFCHIVDDGNHRSTCTSGLFGLCLCIGGFAVDFLSALRPADIVCEPGKFLRKLLLRVYDRPLPISVSDRSHPAFVEALSYFLTEKGALALDLFSVVELPLTDGDRHVWSIVTAYAVAPLASRQNAPSLYMYLGARSRHGLSSFYSEKDTLARTLNITEPGRKEETVRSHLDRRWCAIFFYVSRATSDPARQ